MNFNILFNNESGFVFIQFTVSLRLVLNAWRYLADMTSCTDRGVVASKVVKITDVKTGQSSYYL